MKSYFLKYPMLIHQRLPLILKWFLFFFIVLFACAIGNSKAGDLSEILPVDSTLGDVKPVGGPQRAEGKELFELINGGAVTFLQQNFERALFQEYVVEGGKSINLEIYQMASAQDAKGVYTVKKGKDGAIQDFGQEGLLFDYFCMLYKGPYFISITGADSTDAVRKVLTLIARQVVDNIKIMP